MSERSSDRLFFALWLPPPVAEGLHRHVARLAATPSARIMRPETLHLTLAFLGERPHDELPVLKQIGAQVAGRTRPFELELDRFGHWPRNRIVWLGCAAPAPVLIGLAEDLAGELRRNGLASAQQVQGFTPHVTLMRGCPLPPPGLAGASGVALAVEAMHLVASRREGSRADYVALATFPFAARGD